METVPKIENHILRFDTNYQNTDLAGAKISSKELFEESLKNSCNKILITGDLYSETLSSAELIVLGEYHSHIMPSIIRMAVVGSEKHFEKLKLWEEVCVGRGAKVKVFPDEKGAIEWLGHVN